MTHDVQAATGKVGIAWLLTGLSAMTPLQWVQFIAGVGAIVYTGLQIWVLIRDKFGKSRQWPEVPKQ